MSDHVQCETKSQPQWTNIKNIGSTSSLGNIGTFVTEVAEVTSDSKPNQTVTV